MSWRLQVRPDSGNSINTGNSSSVSGIGPSSKQKNETGGASTSGSHALSSMAGGHDRRHPPQVPLLYHLAFPLFVALVTGVWFARSLDASIDALSETCDYNPSCIIVQFFRSALSSYGGVLFLAELLAFVGGWVAVLMLESARPSYHEKREGEAANLRGFVIRNPLFCLLLAQLVSAAMVLPCFLLPAYLVEKRARTRRRSKRRDENRKKGIAEADNKIAKYSIFRDQFSLQHTLPPSELHSMTLALFGGFVIPSAFMLLTALLYPESIVTPASDSASTMESKVGIYSTLSIVILLWQFFPAFVTLIRKACRLIFSKISPPSIRKPKAHDAEGRAGTIEILFDPITHISTIIHWIYIHNLFTSNASSVTGFALPAGATATKILYIDFFAVITQLGYWLWIEGGNETLLWALGTGILFGPCAGLCQGWIVREEKIVKEEARKLAGRSRKGSRASISSRGAIAGPREQTVLPLLPEGSSK